MRACAISSPAITLALHAHAGEDIAHAFVSLFPPTPLTRAVLVHMQAHHGSNCATADEPNNSTDSGPLVGAILGSILSLIVGTFGLYQWQLYDARNKAFHFTEEMIAQVREQAFTPASETGLQNGKAAQEPSGPKLKRSDRALSVDTESLVPTILATSGSGYDTVSTTSTTSQPREISAGSLRTVKRIGGGAFGDVYLGVLDERSSNGIPAYKVAVKIAKQEGTETEEANNKFELMREALLMAQFRHPNVLGLVGVITRHKQCKVVLQHCDKGALQSMLRSDMFNEGAVMMPEHSALRVS